MKHGFIVHSKIRIKVIKKKKFKNILLINLYQTFITKCESNKGIFENLYLLMKI